MGIDTKAIANRIRLTRIQKGYSQSYIAKRIGKNQSYVSRCEGGLKRLGIEELAMFAEIFEVGLTKLLGNEEEKHD